LLAVLWLVAVLSFAVFTGLGMVVSQAEIRTAHLQEFRAQQRIESAVALAAHPAVDPADPLLAPRDDGAERTEVSLESEAGRFHLNALLAGEQTALLDAIFLAWGLPPTEAEALRDQLLDAFDGDELTRLHGAERPETERLGLPPPPNRPFRTLDEVAAVPALAAWADRFPDWQNWFTLWSESGRLDVHDAPVSRLAVALGVTPESAETLVRHRDGPDGEPHTPDDRRFESLDEVIALAGAPSPDLAAGRLTLTDAVSRIIVTATVGDRAFRRELALRRGPNPQIHWWKERAAH
jgi:hypothetical protein